MSLEGRNAPWHQYTASFLNWYRKRWKSMRAQEWD
jgi:hypothetical protein